MNFSYIIKFIIDLLAVLLLALGIKGLSKVRSAREANFLAAFAMFLSVVGLLLSNYLGESGIPDQSWMWIILGSLVGSLFGALLAKTVPMTSMPETVALFNGFGGLLWRAGSSGSDLAQIRQTRRTPQGRIQGSFLPLEEPSSETLLGNKLR